MLTQFPPEFPLTLHNKPYPGTSPTRPEISQAGRTVLVCGASTGIGRAIARNFCAAKAARVIITARRPDVLASTVKELSEAHPATEVIGKVSDVLNLTAGAELWDGFQAEGTNIDVLVWNAVGHPELKPLIEQGSERLWQDYENNLHCPLYAVNRFYHQPNHDAQKHFLFVSTQDIHNWGSAPQMPGYQLVKSACTATMQQIARDTPAEKMQMLSFHPSTVFTEAAKMAGYTEDTLPWVDENVPGQFAVWAASPEAKFLHGRFVWATWDVTELTSGAIRKKFDEDPWFLKVGVKGL